MNEPSATMDPADTRNTLEYATPSQAFKPVNLAAARTWRGIVIASVSIGVLILVAFRLTAMEGLPEIGFLWFFIGGAATSIGVLIGILSLFLIRSGAPNASEGRRIYAITVLIGVLSYPIAFGCSSIGTHWMNSPHFRLRVYNDTFADIDSVTTHFDGAAVQLGPIKKGAFATSSLQWVSHSGPLWITVNAAGDERRIVDRVFTFNGPNQSRAPHVLSGPYFDVRVETRELPQSLLAATRPSVP